MKHILFTVAIAIGAVSNAFSGWITSWGNGSDGTEFSILQQPGTITILKGDDNEYKFYSETSQGSGVEGVINNITVADGVTGNFTVLIDHPTAGEHGASHWQNASFRNEGDGYTWTLVGADISGNLAANAAGTPRRYRC